MNVKYSYATISFCPDLTSPSAPSTPVGIVGIWDFPDPSGAFIFLAVRPNPEELLQVHDEISTKLLRDVPNLLRHEVEQGLKELGPERLLSSLHDRLRNSLHVSRIEEGKRNFAKDSLASRVLTESLKFFTTEVVRTQPGQGRRTAEAIPQFRLDPVTAMGAEAI